MIPKLPGKKTIPENVTIPRHESRTVTPTKTPTSQPAKIPTKPAGMWKNVSDIGKYYEALKVIQGRGLEAPPFMDQSQLQERYLKAMKHYGTDDYTKWQDDDYGMQLLQGLPQKPTGKDQNAFNSWYSWSAKVADSFGYGKAQKPPEVPTTYWNDPKRIIRYLYAAKSTPPGAVKSEWLTGLQEPLQYIYDYLNTKNSDGWMEWDNIDPTDPIMEVLEQLPPPPIEALTKEERSLGLSDWTYTGSTLMEEGYTPVERTLARQLLTPDEYGLLEESQKDVDDQLLYLPKQTVMRLTGEYDEETWANMTIGQKAYASIRTKSWAMGIVNSAPWALAALATGNVPGAAIVLAVGGIMGAASEHIPAAAKLMSIFQLPSQFVMRSLGMTGQFVSAAFDPEHYGTVQEFFQEFGSAWQASKYTYLTIDMFGKDQVRDIHSPEWRQLSKDEVDTAALYNIRQEINLIKKGESNKSLTDLELELRQKYGMTGEIRELILSSILDPLNFDEFMTNAMVETYAINKGDNVLAQAARANKGQGWRRTQGALDIIRTYKEMLHLTPASYLDNMNPSTLHWAGITKKADGSYTRTMWLKDQPTIKTDSVISKIPLVKHIPYLMKLQPEYRANEAIMSAYNIMVHLLQDVDDDPMTQIKYISSLANTSPNAAAILSEQGWTSMPDASVFPMALREVKPYMMDIYNTQWRIPDDSRKIITNLADIMGFEGDDAPFKMLKMINDSEGSEALITTIKTRLAEINSPQARDMLESMDDPNHPLTSIELYNMAKPFIDGDVPLSSKEFMWQLITGIGSRIEKWAGETLGVVPDPLHTKLSKLQKSATGLAIFGFNPINAINNELGNLAASYFTGILGLETTAMRNDYFGRFGTPPMEYRKGAMMEAVMNRGDIVDVNIEQVADISGSESRISKLVKDTPPGSTIQKFKRVKPPKVDVIGAVDDTFRNVNKKFGIFSKLSNLFERKASESAIYNATRKFMANLWVEGDGFDRLPPITEQWLSDIDPDLPDAYYSAIRSGVNPEEIRSAVYDSMARKTLNNFVTPEQKTTLIDHGIYDNLNNRLATANNTNQVIGAFENTIKEAQTTLDEMVIQQAADNIRLKAQRISAEGQQAFADMWDNANMDSLDFFYYSMRHNEETYLQSLDMDTTSSRMWKKQRFAEIDREWRRHNELHAQMKLAALEGMGASDDIVNEQHNLMFTQDSNWAMFFDDRTKLSEGIIAGNQGSDAGIIQARAIVERIVGTAKMEELLGEGVADFDSARYWAAQQGVMDIRYDQANQMDLSLQEDFDNLLADAYEAKYPGSRQAILDWRANRRAGRQKYVNAMRYFRGNETVEIDAGLAKRIDDILRGKDLANLTPDQRHKAWRTFDEKIRRQLVAEYIMQGQTDAARIYQESIQFTPGGVIEPAKAKLVRLGYPIEEINKMTPEDMIMAADEGKRYKIPVTNDDPVNSNRIKYLKKLGMDDAAIEEMTDMDARKMIKDHKDQFIWELAARHRNTAGEADLAGYDNEGNLNKDAKLNLIKFVKKWGDGNTRKIVKRWDDISPGILEDVFERERTYYENQRNLSEAEVVQPEVLTEQVRRTLINPATEGLEVDLLPDDQARQQAMLEFVQKHNPDAGVTRYEDITPEQAATAETNWRRAQQPEAQVEVPYQVDWLLNKSIQDIPIPELQKRIAANAEWLLKNIGGGVEFVRITDQDGEVTKTSRISANEVWYRKLYEEFEERGEKLNRRTFEGALKRIIKMDGSDTPDKNKYIPAAKELIQDLMEGNRPEWFGINGEEAITYDLWLLGRKNDVAKRIHNYLKYADQEELDSHFMRDQRVMNEAFDYYLQDWFESNQPKELMGEDFMILGELETAPKIREEHQLALRSRLENYYLNESNRQVKLLPEMTGSARITKDIFFQQLQEAGQFTPQELGALQAIMDSTANYHALRSNGRYSPDDIYGKWFDSVRTEGQGKLAQADVNDDMGVKARAYLDEYTQLGAEDLEMMQSDFGRAYGFGSEEDWQRMMDTGKVISQDQFYESYPKIANWQIAIDSYMDSVRMGRKLDATQYQYIWEAPNRQQWAIPIEHMDVDQWYEFTDMVSKHLNKHGMFGEDNMNAAMTEGAITSEMIEGMELPKVDGGYVAKLFNNNKDEFANAFPDFRRTYINDVAMRDLKVAKINGGENAGRFMVEYTTFRPEANAAFKNYGLPQGWEVRAPTKNNPSWIIMDRTGVRVADGDVLWKALDQAINVEYRFRMAGREFKDYVPPMRHEMMFDSEVDALAYARNLDGNTHQLYQDEAIGIETKWYFEAQRKIAQIKDDKATPERWRNLIQGRIKSDEWELLDLDYMFAEAEELLPNYDPETGRVSRQDILDFIEEHKPQVSITRFGETDPDTARKNKLRIKDMGAALSNNLKTLLQKYQWNKSMFSESDWDQIESNYWKDLNRADVDIENIKTLWDFYEQIYGGLDAERGRYLFGEVDSMADEFAWRNKNYPYNPQKHTASSFIKTYSIDWEQFEGELNELISYYPMASKELIETIESVPNDYIDSYMWGRQKIPQFTPNQYDQYVLPEARDYRELFVTLPGMKANDAETISTWNDGHGLYDSVRNPVVRNRISTRKGKVTPAPSKAGEAAVPSANLVDDPKHKRIMFIEEMQPPAKQDNVPQFVYKHWKKIGAKYDLLRAVAEGHDSVGWTTGQLQVDRYSPMAAGDILTLQVTDFGFEMYVVRPKLRDDNKVLVDRNVNLRELRSLLSEELVNAVNRSEPFRGIEGKQIDIGTTNPAMRYRIKLEQEDIRIAKGLKNVYDQDIPNIYKKMINANGWDTEVTKTKIETVPGTTLLGRSSVIEADDGKYYLRYDASDLYSPSGSRVGLLTQNGITLEFDSVDEAIAFRNNEANRMNVDGLSEDIWVMGITPEMRAQILSEGMPLLQKGKAATDFLHDGRSIMYLFENADVSSALHEFSHTLLRNLLPDDLDVVNRWLKEEHNIDTQAGWNSELALNKAAHEQFARAYERYFRDGVLPKKATAGLKRVFQQLKQWMVQIYKRITGSPVDIKITDEMRELFDRFITEPGMDWEVPVKDTGQPFQPTARPYPGLIPDDQPTTGHLDEINHDPPDPVNMPLGGINTDMPAPNLEGRIETFRNDVLPLLGEIQSKAMREGMSEPSGGLLNRVEKGLIDRHVRQHGGSTEEALNEITPELSQFKQAMEAHLSHVNDQLSTTKYSAKRYGTMMRNAALLDYNKRINLDPWTELVFPYQFWYTRSMLNWALRGLSKPSMMALYSRLRSWQTQGTKRLNFPTRLGKKMAIRIPFLPDWMGDSVYVDPLNDIFQFEQISSPLDKLVEQTNLQSRRASQLVIDWMEEGEVPEQAGEEALMTKQGDVWARAMTESWNMLDKEIANPFDLAFTTMSPSLPVNWAYNYLTGKPENISPMPMTNFFRTMTAFAGLNKGKGINLEAPMRKMLGLPEVDMFHDYRMEAMLANMAAEGKYSTQQIMQAQVDQEGEVWQEAQKRLNTLGLIKYIGAPLSLDFFPEGEQELRSTRIEYDNARKAGNLPEFFEQHPEYQNQLLAWQDNPEERIKRFLISEVWQKWNDMPKVHKRQLQEQLGEPFTEGFLDKNTRSYETLTTETLATWAQLMGGYVPKGVEAPTINMKFAPDEEAQKVEDYYTQREEKFGDNYSDLLTLYYNLPEGKREEFERMYPQISEGGKFKQSYLADNPEAIKWLISEDNKLYGLPQDIQQYVYSYRAARDQNFPNIFKIQNQYYTLPESNKKARRAFLEEHPELIEYWQWKREIAAMYPQAAPYIQSDESLSRDILGDREPGNREITPIPQELVQALSPELVRALLSYVYTGREMGSGAMAEMDRLFGLYGQGFSSVEHMMESLINQNYLGSDLMQ